MTIEIDKQFAGNYVRLVNQVRGLQGDLQRMTEAFDNSTQLNNKLHDEIRLKDKMIGLMAKSSAFDDSLDLTPIINMYKEDAISELVAEQNKKAANCESI